MHSERAASSGLTVKLESNILSVEQPESRRETD